MSQEFKNVIDDALFNFYLDADKATIRDSLTENNLNLEDYEKKKKKFMFLAKAVANKKHNEYLLQLVNKFQEAISLNIEKPISILNQLIQGNSTPAYYRNLEKLTKEDIIEIIKDKNFIQLLEQLEENDKKQ